MGHWALVLHALATLSYGRMDPTMPIRREILSNRISQLRQLDAPCRDHTSKGRGAFERYAVGLKWSLIRFQRHKWGV